MENRLIQPQIKPVSKFSQSRGSPQIQGREFLSTFRQKFFLRMIAQAASLLCGFLTAACSAQPINDDSSYAANVGIVNHTAQYIHSASVNGAGGANMGAWGAGMGNVCCALVPTHWYPGMQVVVRWDVPEGSKHVYQEKRVEVERYDEPGSIYL